jgi:hypothetical protein
MKSILCKLTIRKRGLIEEYSPEKPPESREIYYDYGKGGFYKISTRFLSLQRSQSLRGLGTTKN